MVELKARQVHRKAKMPISQKRVQEQLYQGYSIISKSLLLVMAKGRCLDSKKARV